MEITTTKILNVQEKAMGLRSSFPGFFILITTTMKEIWKDIGGHEGDYQVSCDGRVKSINRIVKHSKGGTKLLKEIVLRPSLSIHGYYRVSLSKKGLRKYYSVHRLVAKAFIVNIDNKRTVNHKNGIKTDNKAINLEWNTQSENCKHAYKTGLSKVWNKGVVGYISKTSKTVIQKDMSNNVLTEFSTISNAKRKTGVNHIAACCRNKRKTAGGYKWAFKNDTNRYINFRYSKYNRIS